MRSGGVVMTTAVDRAPGAQRRAGLVARVSDDELAKPTACPAYRVGDLIAHVSGLARAFPAGARKEFGPQLEQAPSGQAARLEPGWRARIPADLQRLARAWGEPGAWTGMTRIAGTDSPGDMVGLTGADELVVHGWGGAPAAGRPYDRRPRPLRAAARCPAKF